VLSHERLPLALAAVAALLALPSAGTGFVLDDFVLRAVALGAGREAGVAGSRFDLFTFFSDAPSEHLREMDAGWAPWWAAADLRVRFFQPLSSFTHWLDFQIWGSSPGEHDGGIAHDELRGPSSRRRVGASIANEPGVW
jgi:hypothetical protein